MIKGVSILMNVVTKPLASQRFGVNAWVLLSQPFSIMVKWHIEQNMESVLILYLLSTDSTQLILDSSMSSGKFLT